MDAEEIYKKYIKPEPELGPEPEPKPKIDNSNDWAILPKDALQWPQYIEATVKDNQFVFANNSSPYEPFSIEKIEFILLTESFQPKCAIVVSYKIGNTYHSIKWCCDKYMLEQNRDHLIRDIIDAIAKDFAKEYVKDSLENNFNSEFLRQTNMFASL